MSTLVLAALAFAVVQAQETSAFSFFSDTTTVTPGSTNTITLCAVQTQGGANHSQSIPVGSVISFTFGPGFGNVNSFSNPRITPWTRSTPSSNPVTIADFTVTSNPLNGKIRFTYNALTPKDMAYRDQLCVDVSWTAPEAPTENVIDMDEDITNPDHPGTRELQIFVRSVP